MRHTKTAHRVLSSYCSSNIPQSQKVCWKSNESRSSTLVKTFSEQQRILDKSEFSHASHTLTISAFGHVTQWLLFRLDSTERKRRRLYWWSVTFLRRSGFSAAPQRFFVKFVNDSSLGARGDAVQQLVGVEQSLEWWKIEKNRHLCLSHETVTFTVRCILHYQPHSYLCFSLTFRFQLRSQFDSDSKPSRLDLFWKTDIQPAGLRVAVSIIRMAIVKYTNLRRADRLYSYGFGQNTFEGAELIGCRDFLHLVLIGWNVFFGARYQTEVAEFIVRFRPCHRSALDRRQRYVSAK